jgi:hypothetical protein
VTARETLRRFPTRVQERHSAVLTIDREMKAISLRAQRHQLCEGDANEVNMASMFKETASDRTWASGLMTWIALSVAAFGFIAACTGGHP